jgi:hypothetical protein
MVAKTALEDYMRKIALIGVLSMLPLLASADLYITIIQGLGGAAIYDQQFT